MLALSGADADIVAVHDPDGTRASDFVARHGGVVVDTEESVLDACDAVYVCTWTSEHPRLVAMAAARGLPVFCEKPLGVDLAAAAEVASSAAGVTNQVGLVLRDAPAMLWLRAMLADPTDGAVLTVVFRDDQYFPIRGIYGSQWRADRQKAGAGTLLEHSIHDLDLLEWLVEPVEGKVVEVSARTRHVAGIDGIEDVATVGLVFAGGATANLTSVWHDVLSRPSQRRLEVFRQRAWYAVEGDVFGPVRWLRTDGDELAAASSDGGGGWTAGAPVEPERLADGDLVAELGRLGVPLRFPDAGFVDSVARAVPATPDAADALRAHQLVDVAYRSATSGGTWLTV